MGKVNLLRFDFSGCGLSDGNFEDLTVKKLSSDLKSAVNLMQNYSTNITLVAHSLAGCVVLDYLQNGEKNIKKAVFLSPALNQKKLQRFWFVTNAMKKSKVETNWDNYQKYLKEKDFEEWMNIKKRMTKANFISNGYFLENKEVDYTALLEKIKLPMLIVHGDADDKVPLESYKPSKQVKLIKVAGGDHDLERPDMVEQYLNKIVVFISN
jgi:pimeloyl-ACP methyl ester carboxylesterase